MIHVLAAPDVAAVDFIPSTLKAPFPSDAIFENALEAAFFIHVLIAADVANLLPSNPLALKYPLCFGKVVVLNPIAFAFMDVIFISIFWFGFAPTCNFFSMKLPSNRFCLLNCVDCAILSNSVVNASNSSLIASRSMVWFVSFAPCTANSFIL